jgi:hypothetical protein
MDGAEEKAAPVVPVGGIPGRADDRGSVLDEMSGDGLVCADSGLGVKKQRWTREAYNRYQRDYMRKRRGKAP